MLGINYRGIFDGKGAQSAGPGQVSQSSREEMLIGRELKISIFFQLFEMCFFRFRQGWSVRQPLSAFGRIETDGSADQSWRRCGWVSGFLRPSFSVLLLLLHCL